MKTETEIRVMQPQTKDCLEPPEAGRDRISPGPFRGRTTLLTSLNFQPLEL